MSEAKLSELSVSELSDMLTQLNFINLKSILREHEISGRMLSELTSAEELQSIDGRIRTFEARGWFKEILEWKKRLPTAKPPCSNLECIICYNHYSEVTPTFLPCGHSLCIDDARAVDKCPKCSVGIPPGFAFAVSYDLRTAAEDEIQNSRTYDTNATSEVVNEVREEEEVKDEVKEVKKNQEVAYEQHAVVADSNLALRLDKTPNLRPELLKQIAKDFERAAFYLDPDAIEALKNAAGHGNIHALGFYVLYLAITRCNAGMFDFMMDACLPRLTELTDMYALFIVAMWQQMRKLGNPAGTFARCQHSADLGFTLANVVLGLCYQYGYGVGRSQMKGFECFYKAIEADHHIGYYYCGVHTEKSNPHCLKFLQRAADCGIMNAVTLMGQEIKSNKGTEYLQIASMYGEMNAMWFLSQKEPNSGLSTTWLTRAAVLGQKQATEHLVNLYRQQKNTHDIPEKLLKDGNDFYRKMDYIEAVGHFKLAAQLKYPEAFYHLGLCYERGTGVGIDLGEARRNYSLGVLAGDPASMVSLGRMHEAGNTVEVNVERAKELYAQAYAKGFARAKELLDRLA